MSIFKKKITLEDILSAIDELTPEEREQITSKLGGTPEVTEDPPAEEPETDGGEPAAEPTETEEGVEAAAEETADDGEAADEPTDETVDNGAETTDPEPEAVEQVAEVSEESEPEAADEGDIPKLYAAIEDLKKTVEALAARLNADDDNSDEKVEFGVGMGGADQTVSEKDELDEIRKKYWNF